MAKSRKTFEEHVAPDAVHIINGARKDGFGMEDGSFITIEINKISVSKDVYLQRIEPLVQSGEITYGGLVNEGIALYFEKRDRELALSKLVSSEQPLPAARSSKRASKKRSKNLLPFQQKKLNKAELLTSKVLDVVMGPVDQADQGNLKLCKIVERVGEPSGTVWESLKLLRERDLVGRHESTKSYYPKRSNIDEYFKRNPRS